MNFTVLVSLVGSQTVLGAVLSICILLAASSSGITRSKRPSILDETFFQQNLKRNSCLKLFPSSAKSIYGLKPQTDTLKKCTNFSPKI